MDVVRIVAPAKVNLFLGVGGLRPDGYHDVTTVLHTLELSDRVTIEPSDRLSLECEPGLDIPAEKNLAYRAAAAMGAAFGREPAVRVVLEKLVPHGAGLGGGSSDAAAVIAGLATMWDVSPMDPRCIDVARSLGSDVPFFLLGGAALMTGRGDVFARHLPALDAPVAVFKPPASISTAAAYRAFDQAPRDPGVPDAVVSALQKGDAQALGASLANNLADVAVSLVPELIDALASVRGGGGVLGACVAGSGSAAFALCGDEQARDEVVERFRDIGWFAAATRLNPAGVEVVDEWEVL